MVKHSEILVTGGSGLLGTELYKLLPGARFPTHQELDISDVFSILIYFNKAGSMPKIILHCAAMTKPPSVEGDPNQAIKSNIIGTANLVHFCNTYKVRLVYISTDYVFDGKRELYKEDDPVLPTNKYGWSKLGGECAMQLSDNGLIIRTSFGPKPFPYPKAFSDQWTTREPVDITAQKIIDLLSSNLTGVIHIGGNRQTVYDYAKSIGAEEVEPTPKAEFAPQDTSLDCTKYSEYIKYASLSL